MLTLLSSEDTATCLKYSMGSISTISPLIFSLLILNRICSELTFQAIICLALSLVTHRAMNSMNQMLFWLSATQFKVEKLLWKENLSIASQKARL